MNIYVEQLIVHISDEFLKIVIKCALYILQFNINKVQMGLFERYIILNLKVS